MPSKVTRVKAARKPGQVCGNCREPIQVGQPYQHWSFRYGGTRKRCMKPECAPQVWELESNSKRSALLQADSLYHDAHGADTPRAAADALEECIGLVEGAAEEFASAVDGWTGTGLENSEQYDAFSNAQDELERWCSDAQQVCDNLRELADELEADEDAEPDDDWRQPLEYLDAIPEPEF
jgi:uncharacterized protein YukE